MTFFVRRDKIWVVRYLPQSGPEFYRVFSSWSDLLQSLSLAPEIQNPSWKHPFEIWQVDFDRSSAQEVSSEVLNVVSTTQNPTGIPGPDWEEPDPQGHF